MRNRFQIVLVALLWVSSGTIAEQEPATLDDLERKIDQAQSQEQKRRAQEAREREARQRQAEATRTAEAAKATLIVKSDASCTLRINGVDERALVAGEAVTVKVNPGQQLIECKAADGSVTELTESVAAGDQKVVRLVATQPIAPIAAPDPPAPQTPQPAPAEQQMYEAAFSHLREGRYAQSAKAFAEFLRAYPSGDLAPNATYWLGESHYVTQNYAFALQNFQELLAKFPNSGKAPDALLKVGYCNYELRRWDEAKRALSDVISRYPGTTVARLAEGRLRALNLEGR